MKIPQVRSIALKICRRSFAYWNYSRPLRILFVWSARPLRPQKSWPRGLELSSLHRVAAQLFLLISAACMRHLVQRVCLMKIEGLPVIDVDESEEITVAVRADDLLEGGAADPEQHPIAIALRRQNDVDDARVTNNETLVRRGKQWLRYGAPDRRLFSSCKRR